MSIDKLAIVDEIRELNQWKEETCGTCDFVPGGWHPKSICGGGKCRKVAIAECRKDPPSIPTIISRGRTKERYPVVYKSTSACSHWREKQT